MFLGSKVRLVRRADNLMSRLSRQCGILNISQPYRPPRPVTGIASVYFFFKYYITYLLSGIDKASLQSRAVYRLAVQRWRSIDSPARARDSESEGCWVGQ
jgi:hypothetical protein